MEDKRKIIVISGTSGAGKTTLIHKLKLEYPNIKYVKSYTTRLQRPGEEDYNFLTRDEFEEKIKLNELLEYEEYCGNYYGTPKLKLNSNYLLDIERNGVRNLNKIKNNKEEDWYFIFIEVNMDILKSRLHNRSIKDLSAELIEEFIRKRIENYEKDLILKNEGIYDFIILNDELEKCYNELKNILKKIKFI